MSLWLAGGATVAGLAGLITTLGMLKQAAAQTFQKPKILTLRMEQPL